MIEQTKQLLSKMKLLGMFETVDARLTEATSHGWGHAEFLSALVTDEKLHRDNRQIKSRIRVAQFRTDASIEQLDLTAKRSVTKTQVNDLMELTFVKAPKNVLILGPTGVGKTYLATALGNWACRHGFTCIFIGINLLIERLAVSRADGSYLKYRDKLVKTDLLILDDLGIKALPPETVQDLYDVLEERYQSKATVVTSQLPLTHWKEVIEDTIALEAILDRLIHGAIKIEMNGESYRKKRGEKKKAVDTP